MDKKRAKKLMSKEGETRGLGLKTEAEFLVKKRGEKALERLEKVMAELGYPLSYDDIQKMSFYPVGRMALVLTLLKEEFGFDDEMFREMGRFEAKMSLIIKLFMRYFTSIDNLVDKAPIIWGKYQRTGDFKITEHSEGRAVVSIENFNISPYMCRVCEGYFAAIVGLVIGKEVYCREEECIHEGDSRHKFIAKW